MAGSVEKRGPNKWRLIVSHGFDGLGKRIKHTKTIDATSRSKAEKELAMFMAEIERGEYIEPSKLTFKTFAEKWIEDYAIPNLEIRTYTSYIDIIQNRFIPEFGNLKLEQIKPLHLIGFFRKMSQDGARMDGKPGGLAAKTIRNYHKLLSSMMRDAVYWQLIPSNPVSRVQAPKNKRPKISFYDDDQLIMLLQKLMDEPIKYRTLITICIYLGIRRGEVLALTWDDIDFKEQVFTISRSINYSPKTGVYEKAPKTDNSIRTISFSDSVKDILIQYKAWQEEQIEIMGDLWTEKNRLFLSTEGKLMHPDTPSQWFAKFIKKHDLPHITLHGIRHSNASILIASGMDLRTISTRLGHAQPSFTLGTYGHMLKKSDKIAADKIEELLKF